MPSQNELDQSDRDLELIYENHPLENVLQKCNKEEKSVVHICPCIHISKRS